MHPANRTLAAPISIDPLASRQSSRLTGKEWLFAAVFAMFIVDINAVAFLLSGQLQIGSMLLLGGCLAVMTVYQFRIGRSLGAAGRSYAAFLAFFVGMAIVVRLTELSSMTVFQSVYFGRMYGSSLLILIVSAIGAYHIGGKSPNRVILIVVFLQVIQILAVFIGIKYPHLIYAADALEGTKTGQVLEKSGRAIGFFANPNETGFAMAYTAVFCFAAMRGNSKLSKLLFVVIFAAGVACVTTLSRSSIMAFLLVCVAQPFVSSMAKRPSLSILLAVAVALGGFFWFLTVGYKDNERFTEKNANIERMESFEKIASGDFSNKYTGHRFKMYNNGFSAWSNSPVFGLGLGNGHTIGPHNQFIGVLVDLGIVGLIPYLIAIFIVIRHAWSCKDPQIRNMALAFGVVFLFQNLVSHTIFTKNDVTALTGVTFGLLAAQQMTQRNLKRRRRILAQQSSLVGAVR